MTRINYGTYSDRGTQASLLVRQAWENPSSCKVALVSSLATLSGTEWVILSEANDEMGFKSKPHLIHTLFCKSMY